MDKKFLTKLLAAVFVGLFYFFLVGTGWQVAAGVALAAFVLDWLFDAFKLGNGWLLFFYGVLGFFAHYWSGLGWDWAVAFGGFGYYVLDVFFNESKLASWVFGLLGI